MQDNYQIGHELGELSAKTADHEHRITRLEGLVKAAKHWGWRLLVLCAIWGWPVIALLKGPDIANSIASILKAALTR